MRPSYRKMFCPLVAITSRASLGPSGPSATQRLALAVDGSCTIRPMIVPLIARLWTEFQIADSSLRNLPERHFGPISA
jgi:hypothetical protein